MDDDNTFLDDLIRTAKWPLIGLAVLFAICFTAGYFAG
jgi:hypothetical protein